MHTFNPRQRQANLWVQERSALQREFQASQGYIVKPCLKFKIKEFLFFLHKTPLINHLSFLIALTRTSVTGFCGNTACSTSFSFWYIGTASKISLLNMMDVTQPWKVPSFKEKVSLTAFSASLFWFFIFNQEVITHQVLLRKQRRLCDSYSFIWLPCS